MVRHAIGAIFLIAYSRGNPLHAGEKALVNTVHSPYAALYMPDLDDVQFTGGFWGERYAAIRATMVPHLWEIFQDEQLSHAWANFQLAAGIGTGRDGKHHGPAFNDGDFYKWFEGLAMIYAATKDPAIDRLMDRIIPVIAQSQRADGYLHTKTIIAQKSEPAEKAPAQAPQKIENPREAGSPLQGEPVTAFAERLHFETYNMGHLMTAACVHHRATGKDNFLDMARKVCDFLYNYYQTQTPSLARSAICPAHYMGVVEMYRTTGDPRYRELARQLIEIRGMVEEGTDDNQDRVPFREMTEALGHAVRANYLYAGVADVFAETGDRTLLDTLLPIWRDVVYQKMYVTGATGALYDGVSPFGEKKYDRVQRTHQAYGYDYQLPNITAYNESCATIGNLLWNWRMLLASGEAQYADIVERVLYNGVLPTISLEGKDYFYVNPLRTVEDLTIKLRWARHRQHYYGSFCCPPNIVRTLAEAPNYSYTLSTDTLWVQLYSANTLDTEWLDGSRIRLKQETEYPWHGSVKLTIEEAPVREITLKLRIPAWVHMFEAGHLMVNDQFVHSNAKPGSYAKIKRVWKMGDTVRLTLPMRAECLAANPKVEEVRNQVAVRRGPLIYCLEIHDLPEGKTVEDAALTFNNRKFEQKKMTIAGVEVVGLEIAGLELRDEVWSNDVLYRPLTGLQPREMKFTLIPYFAWDNRGEGAMSVWLPVR